MISPLIKQGIDFYAEHGYEPGGFLRSCLENDLYGAVGRADDASFVTIGEIVLYIDDHIPRESWGSAKKVNAWIKAKAAQRETVSI